MSQNDRTTRVRLRSRVAALGWGAWGALAIVVVAGIWLAVLQPLSRSSSVDETILAIPPAELRELSSRGQLPPLAPAQTQQSAAPFAKCVSRAVDLEYENDDYPRQVLIDRSDEYAVRQWTATGAVTLTCSAASDLMTVTTEAFLAP